MKKTKKSCREDQVINPKTGRCIKKKNLKTTNKDKILNPKTGRYVLKTGAIGKKILQDKEKNKTKPTLSNGNCFYSAIYIGH